MTAGNAIKTIRTLVKDIDFEEKNLLSINDLTNDQIYGLFELARALEPWNRSAVALFSKQCFGGALLPAQHPYPYEL